MNENSAMFSTPAPFALSLSKGKRGVFQHHVRADGAERAEPLGFLWPTLFAIEPNFIFLDRL